MDKVLQFLTMIGEWFLGILNVENLLNALPIMGYGMTGIFAVTLVIIVVVYLLKLIPNKN